MKSKLVHQHRYSTRLQSRLTASNRNLKNKGRRSQEELVAEVLNPEQLDRESQAPKTKAEEAQITEEMSMLQRGEAAVGAITVENPGGVVTFIPPKFKVPDFDQYHGTGCPSNHLKMYVRKMSAYAHDDKVLIHFFQNSLTGASLDWYMQLPSSDVHSWKNLLKAFLKYYQHNLDPAPDRSQLQFMSKKDRESFEEYAQRWRSVAAQVKPPLTEKEIVSMFMDTLPAVFYKRLIGRGPSRFSDVIRVGARLEVEIKRGRVPCNPIGANNAIGERRKSRQLDSIPMPYTDLFNYLITNKLITTRPMKPVRPPYFRGYNPNSTCAFHEGAVGHIVENCKAFKHAVQDLVDADRISFKQNSSNTTTNPLPGLEKSAANAIESSVGRVIRSAEKVKTPLEVLHAELCKFGVIKGGCTQKGVYVDVNCTGACEAFKTVLQDLLDRHTTQIGVQEYKDGHGLGYRPTQADKKRMAEEKQEKRSAKLQRREPNLQEVPIYDSSLSIPVCDIRQSFVSAGLLDHNQIAAIGNGSEAEESETSLVRRCLARES